MKNDSTAKGHVVLAAAAHPDDIEFMMAGTLLLAGEQGAEIHMWNLSSGRVGSDAFCPEETATVRWNESLKSADLAGAVPHPSITHEFDLLYTRDLVSQVAVEMRRIRPTIILVPSLEDYMEDHQNAARLLVTGAFTRAMKNFEPDCGVEPYSDPVAIYHAMPYGLRDGMRRLVSPGMYVDIGTVIAKKRAMLACHDSQKSFLDVTQGLDAYLTVMEDMSRDVGSMSGRYEYAEGWRRHLHLGFSDEGYDPLSEMLSERSFIDQSYEDNLGII